MTFDDWIEELEVRVIQEEFGYEPGEFNVTPSLWRPSYDRGDTPLQAFQSALNAAAEARRKEDHERAERWRQIQAEDAAAIARYRETSHGE